jgi:hypothetical protein
MSVASRRAISNGKPFSSLVFLASDTFRAASRMSCFLICFFDFRFILAGCMYFGSFVLSF